MTITVFAANVSCATARINYPRTLTNSFLLCEERRKNSDAKTATFASLVRDPVANRSVIRLRDQVRNRINLIKSSLLTRFYFWINVLESVDQKVIIILWLLYFILGQFYSLSRCWIPDTTAYGFSVYWRSLVEVMRDESWIRRARVRAI